MAMERERKRKGYIYIYIHIYISLNEISRVSAFSTALLSCWNLTGHTEKTLAHQTIPPWTWIRKGFCWGRWVQGPSYQLGLTSASWRWPQNLLAPEFGGWTCMNHLFTSMLIASLISKWCTGLSTRALTQSPKAMENEKTSHKDSGWLKACSVHHRVKAARWSHPHEPRIRDTTNRRTQEIDMNIYTSIYTQYVLHIHISI